MSDMFLYSVSRAHVMLSSMAGGLSVPLQGESSKSGEIKWNNVCVVDIPYVVGLKICAHTLNVESHLPQS